MNSSARIENSPTRSIDAQPLRGSLVMLKIANNSVDPEFADQLVQTLSQRSTSQLRLAGADTSDLVQE